MPQGVGVRVSSWVLNRKTPDKALFIRGFWFDKVASKYKTFYLQVVTCSSSEGDLVFLIPSLLKGEIFSELRKAENKYLKTDKYRLSAS